ncbi:MAG: hypothetical protein FWB92_06450 [Oscillospiraceae bacterium]|nr:hypothetical protein [Oscillospiraceae bacterium]
MVISDGAPISSMLKNVSSVGNGVAGVLGSYGRIAPSHHVCPSGIGRSSLIRTFPSWSVM